MARMNSTTVRTIVLRFTGLRPLLTLYGWRDLCFHSPAIGHCQSVSGSPRTGRRPWGDYRGPRRQVFVAGVACGVPADKSSSVVVDYNQKPMNPQEKQGDFTPAGLVRTEAAALETLAARLEGPMAVDFGRAVDLIVRCGEGNGRVVVTGMGKSGIIAQKIAATLSSTGSAALFLHPAEAVHGDLGVLMPGDVVIALSASGETEEILRLLATLKRKGDALVSFCCRLDSTLAQASDVVLDCGVEREACGLNLAPTASTTAMLALGDALAVAVSLRKGFRAEDFAELHPGGKLGKQLAKVRDLMHTGGDMPVVATLDADDRRDLPDVVKEARHDDGAGERSSAWRDQ